tara:strand:+ start:385 stop:759 length:375 start_codon:yes stop_codon:yes gene_type:complete
MKLEKQFIKFIIIGCKSTLINYGLYFILYKTTYNIILASTSAYLAGNVNSFIFGKKWVFKSSAINNNFIFIKFLMVYLFGGYLFSTITNYLSLKGIDHRLAWLIGISICTVNNFLGSKYMVFKR